MKTLYLIHHSHTDIGYTQRQEVIRRYHAGFIRHALAILTRRGLDSGFRWQCETFWGVEQFLATASDNERVQLAEAIKAGAIGLSANYANFSEILDQHCLTALTGRAVSFATGIDYDLTSAMTADINGFGWGFAKALHDNSITNLFTCIHTHHGMYPLERHRPFWWRGPDSARVLVWNGEHYHFGNELGLAPDAVSSYLTKDECDAYTVHHDPWKVAELRIPRLFEQLARDDYPYDFLPVMISGLRTDNGPPSEAILDQVNRWNDNHGDEIRVEMSTLDRFFARLRQEQVEIPEYSGDWPDWWTDGVASMPDATALFRDAQRTWAVVRSLRDSHAHDIHVVDDPRHVPLMASPAGLTRHAHDIHVVVDPRHVPLMAPPAGITEHAHDIHVVDDPRHVPLMASPAGITEPSSTPADTVRRGTTERALLDNLALYAEHTYGHAASIVQPWHPLVRTLAERKRSYAALADEQAQALLLDELDARGRATLIPGLPFRYRVLNPHPCTVTDTASLQIEHYEYYENNVYRGVRVVDEATGASLPAATHPTPVTTTLHVPLTLAPGMEKTLRIEPLFARDLTPDHGRPLLMTRDVEADSGVFETDTFRIEWRQPDGITAWIDKTTGQDLLRPDRDHHAFTPVHAVTPLSSDDDTWAVRSEMGLSRNGKNAQWSAGKLVRVRELVSGDALADPVVDERQDSSIPMYRRLELQYEVDGCDGCTVELEAISGLPQVEVSVHVNKLNTLAPENLYLSLPFGSGENDVHWLDKSGGAVRARVDQLPGSLIDFYSVQDGFVVASEQTQVAVAMQDSPLLQLGPLEFTDPRTLHDPDSRHPDLALPYSWLMTNYWETNFAAGLGGFHAFRFRVFSGTGSDPRELLSHLQAANTGFVCFRIRD